MVDVPPGTEQVVVVTASRWSSTTATLRGLRRTDDGWQRAVGPVRAHVGANGLVRAALRRQSTSTTPTGTFRIPQAFGRADDPGTSLPYRRIDRDDVWTYNPAHPSTYNLLQTAVRRWPGPATYIERLWDYGRQYRYVAVIGFNLPHAVTTGTDGVRRAARPADTRRGGGIFLHVSDGTPTAGCVSIAEPAMARLLRWLRPGARIVIRVQGG